jgi:hypothetical protein
MKKLFVSAVAAVALAAFALPASAFENQFGGYWRTRAYTQKDFGPNGTQDLSQVDTRTRLFYTAKFSDDFKFVNKFEFNAVWGDNDGGDIGADGKNDWRIKNSYVDMNLGDWNAKIGTQGGVIARGFILDDDFSGAVLTYKGAGFDVPVMWIKHTEGGMGKKANEKDVDYFVVNPTVKVSDQLSVNPLFMWIGSEDAAAIDPNIKEANFYYLGVNADMDYGMGSAWFTGIYQFGSVDNAAPVLPAGTKRSMDVNAYLVAVGGDVNLDAFNVHGEMFYASGQSATAKDIEAFNVPAGQSYYWSEIMGYGIFDNQVSNNSPADQISNIMAFNLGASMSPMPKLKVTADLWYAKRVEDVLAPNGKMESDLGTEINLKATYKVMDNLNLDVVGAYLFAGDATGKDDPYLVGTRLSFGF